MDAGAVVVLAVGALLAHEVLGEVVAGDAEVDEAVVLSLSTRCSVASNNAMNKSSVLEARL